ncbi:MAG: hypothetical protein PWQ51_237 [Methanolobus sp.]|jgi:hypothetical protein|uniref:Uncharacterized protein n=1 Tax=Methanolobus tindarius DSM 2278 TaxID=1090322 RepID=W9DTY2_METTI|nr:MULTISPECIES: hypothetical protein [Methanolobus]ETA66891.1 hypothetical protein MettiDRAFT_0294 [Methanolobus tindarius DSM 2278]MDI3485999.1 hypothetical protein [Methanolobus sp.]MDK2830388.1 hypothetical protein [Methanolobus sp.]MDK2938073.1 hypothetical protein [Methanolobus sp.]
MSVINVFAIFYVAAQVIERITDSIIKLMRSYDDTKADIEVTSFKIEKIKSRLGVDCDKDREDRLYDELQSQLKYRNQRDNRMVLEIFLMTSFLGIILAFILQIRFLLMLGVAVSPIIDITVTGFLISGGTKPLHDLIKYIEKAKG